MTRVAVLGLLAAAVVSACSPKEPTPEAKTDATSTVRQALTANDPSGLMPGYPYAWGFERPFTNEEILVVAVNFSDDTAEPYTIQAIEDGFFNDSTSVAAYINAVSQGETTVSGDVFGWITVDDVKANCDPDLTMHDAMTILAGQGVDLTKYSKWFLVSDTAGAGGCGGGGSGGYPALAASKVGPVVTSGYIARHETMHMYELEHHRRYDSCSFTASPSGATCTGVEYGHKADIMGDGTSNKGHIFPGASELLGWLNTTSTPAITNVATSGTYTISPVASSATSAKALKIPLDYSGSTGHRYYLVEYRQAVNFDSEITGSQAGLTNGVIISIVQTVDSANKLYQIDMTPLTGATEFDDVLAFGTSYTDPDTGVVISADSGSSASANVTVTIPSPSGSCVPAAPTVTASPVWNKRGVGEAEAYEVVVTNNDVDCGPTSFNLSVTGLEAGWTYSTSPQAVLVDSQASAPALIHVTSASGATPGARVVSVVATDAADGTHTGSASTTYDLTDCVRAVGTITFDDPELIANPDESIDVSVTYTNNNSGGCEGVEISPIVEFVSDGWTLGLGNSGTIASGASTTYTGYVHPPSTAAEGTYTIGALARHELGGSFQTLQPGFAQGTIDVEVADCAQRLPGVSVLPSSPSGYEGTTSSLSVIIDNDDSGTCSASQAYTVTAVVPNGWSWDAPSSPATIAMGATVNVGLDITIPANEPNGTYDIDVIVTAASGRVTTTPIAFQVQTDPNSNCIPAKPSVSITTPQTAAAGDINRYQVNVKNQDSDLCPTKSFDLAASGDALLTNFSWAKSTVTLAPGDSERVQLEVTSDPSAPDGDLNFSATATETDSGTGSRSARYIVSSSCSQSWPSVTITPTPQSGTAGTALTYDVDVFNYDSSPCSDRNWTLSSTVSGGGLTVMLADTALTMSAQATASTTATVTSPGNASVGTYSFSVEVDDGSIYSETGSADYEVVSASSCTPAAPTITVSPGSRSGTAGSEQTYTVSVTNNDSGASCPSRSFAMSSMSDPELTASFDNASLSVSTGATTATTLRVTSNANAADGTYDVSATATDATSGTDTDNATYVVTTPSTICVPSAPTLTLSPTSRTGSAGSQQSYGVVVQNNDTGPCVTRSFSLTTTVDLELTALFDSSNLSISAGGSASTTLRVTSAANASDGTYNLTATAADATSGMDSVAATYIVSTVMNGCTTATPTVMLSPASQTGNAGESKVYVMSVTNNDDSNCNTKSFTFSASGDAELTPSVADTSLPIDPGATRTTNVTVTAGMGASAGTYNFTASASEAASGADTANGTFVISSACVRNAPTIELSPVARAGRPFDTFDFDMVVTNNDSLSCGSSDIALSVSTAPGMMVNVPASLTVNPGETAAAPITVQPAAMMPPPPGTYPFGITAAPPNSASSTEMADVILLPMGCMQFNPTVTVTPVGSGVVTLAGTAVDYQVSIRNNHTVDCGTANLTVELAGPAGWSGTSNWLSIPAQGTSMVTMTVTSPTSLAAGTTMFDVLVVDETTPTYETTAMGAYTVQPIVCAAQAPSITISPSSQAAAPGDSRAYVVDVVNNDSVDCATKSFDLAAGAPSGLTTLLGASSLTLAPGASDITTLDVSVDANAAAGSYNVDVSATEADSGTASAMAQLVVNLPNVCTRANPTVTAVTPTVGPLAAGDSFVIELSAISNDSSACASAVYETSTAAPAGWSATDDMAPINPGAMQTLAVNIATDVASPPGVYGIDIDVRNQAEPTYFETVTVMFEIAGDADMGGSDMGMGGSDMGGDMGIASDMGMGSDLGMGGSDMGMDPDAATSGGDVGTSDPQPDAGSDPDGGGPDEPALRPNADSGCCAVAASRAPVPPWALLLAVALGVLGFRRRARR